ncbi:MAG: serine hydroxymethyltransferase [Mycoplasmataceae bacterium]|nr:serine hydroxymethyltransferase [Mycoplasmataceae bacterium]
MYSEIKIKDKKISNWINKELKRQKEHIELIASENYVSNDVLKATGSILTNKYGEGYPNKRYYGGCENVDQIENIAIERLKKLFNVKYANVQSYSGSTANAAAIAALIPKDGKILGMGLSSGGHLSHGYKISFSGYFYKSYSYDVDENGLLDYDKILEQAKKIKPDLIICGASAYSRIIDFKKFHKIAKEVGAKLMADIAHIAGLVATGLHPSPFEFCDVVTSTTHKTLRGARGGIIMTNNEEVAKNVDKWVFPGYQGGPLFHQIAGKAVAFGEALKPSFKKYQQQVINNAAIFCQEFKNKGIKIISEKTDNHLFMIDVKQSFNLTGKQATEILKSINITVNKNSIPNDLESPQITSGIRVGTPAMTTRGFKEKEFVKLANIIYLLLSNYKNKKIINELKKEVKQLNDKFPI